MSDVLPTWIKIDDAIGDLTQIIPELKTYAAFAVRWRDIAVAVRGVAADAPVDSPVNLATYLAGHLTDPEDGRDYSARSACPACMASSMPSATA